MAEKITSRLTQLKWKTQENKHKWKRNVKKNLVFLR